MSALSTQTAPLIVRTWTPGAVPGGIEIDPAKAPWASELIVPIGWPSKRTCSTSLPVQPPPRNTTWPPASTFGIRRPRSSPSGGYCPAPVARPGDDLGGAPPPPPTATGPATARAVTARRRVRRREGRARPLPMPAAWSRTRLPVMKMSLASCSVVSCVGTPTLPSATPTCRPGVSRAEPRRVTVTSSLGLLAHRPDRVGLRCSRVVARRPASSTTCPVARQLGVGAVAHVLVTLTLDVLGDRRFGAVGVAACCAGVVVDEPAIPTPTASPTSTRTTNRCCSSPRPPRAPAAAQDRCASGTVGRRRGQNPAPGGASAPCRLRRRPSPR